MKELNTIQKRGKLNRVFAADEKGQGGANHEYHVCIDDSQVGVAIDVIDIKFQNGPRHERGSVHGVIDSDLLEIVRHRLQCFQAGPFKSEYNEKALEHLELALMYLNRRVEDRIERNVLGTSNK